MAREGGAGRVGETRGSGAGGRLRGAGGAVRAGEGAYWRGCRGQATGNKSGGVRSQERYSSHVCSNTSQDVAAR